MNYGMKRWALGYGCGTFSMISFYEALAGNDKWIGIACIAIALFFIDCIIAAPSKTDVKD